MLKDLADFPQLIETLINSLVGFLYRTLGTFWTIIQSPRYGALRAYAAKGSLQPLTALFLSASLLAIASVLLPDQVAGMMQSSNRDLASWLIFTFALLLSADAVASVASFIGWRSERRRRRARAMLRYASAFAFAGTFLIALEWRWETNTIFGAAPVGHELPDRPWGVSALLAAFAVLPLAGTAVVLADIPLPLARNRRVPRSMAAAGKRFSWRALASFLPLIFMLMLMHMPARPITILDIPQALAEKEKADEPMVSPVIGEGLLPVRLSPVVCRVGGGADGTFTAALVNRRDEPIALDLSELEIQIFEKDTRITDPRMAVIPVTIVGPSVVGLAPKAATLVEGRFKLPPNALALDFQACFFDELRPG